VLRPATPEDFEYIARIWHQGWSDGHLGNVPEGLQEHRQLSDFRTRVPERIQDTTVAIVDGRVVGFVMVKGDEVEQMYVAAEARGDGTAAALLQHAEDAIAARFDLAWLAVAAGNARARRFYTRNGWYDAGEFDYAAWAEGGTFIVPCHRYEKRLR
jgi:GNAT superfamily N-acetyltransferase